MGSQSGVRRVAALVAVLTALGLVAPTPTASAEPNPPNVFRSAPQSRAAEHAGDQRAREVVLAIDLINQTGPLDVSLNLFDDATTRLTLYRTTEPDDSIAWRGTVAGDPATQVLVVISNGLVFGTAHLGEQGTFSLRDTGKGTLLIIEAGPEPLPRRSDNPSAPGNGSETSTESDALPSSATDGPPTIDVLVVISDDVVATEFGGNEFAAMSWASARIAEFNTALMNSQVTTRGNLIDAVVATYDESRSPTDIETDLERLTFRAGQDCEPTISGVQNCDPAGHLDSILDLRDDLGADIVTLVVSDAVVGSGIAWLTCTPVSDCNSDYLFNVSEFSSADAFYTMSHELGHNLGVNHDAANGGTTYARGYRVPGSFSTVVAYVCTNPSGACSGFAPRVLYYSNPDVLFAGSPMGIAIGGPGEADAATHIDVIGATVAAARDSINSQPVGLVDPAAGLWYLRQGTQSTQFYFGNPGDYPFVGDWDCDGDDTPGLYRQSDGFVYLRNSNTQGVADISFFFGNPGDIPIAGDFDNDGCDTVSIYRPSEGRFFIINALGVNGGGLGAAESDYYFGDPGDKSFVGDFNGDGIETIGLHRESTGLVYFRNTHTQGVADQQFIFGDPGDRLIAGDWNTDGADSPAVYRPTDTTFYFRYTNTQGNADEQATWGSPTWLPISGMFWN